MRPKLEHLEGGSSVDGHAACFMLVGLLQWLRVWFWPISFSSRIMFRRLLKHKNLKASNGPRWSLSTCFHVFFPFTFSRGFVICLFPIPCSLFETHLLPYQLEANGPEVA